MQHRGKSSVQQCGKLNVRGGGGVGGEAKCVENVYLGTTQAIFPGFQSEVQYTSDLYTLVRRGAKICADPRHSEVAREWG